MNIPNLRFEGLYKYEDRRSNEAIEADNDETQFWAEVEKLVEAQDNKGKFNRFNVDGTDYFVCDNPDGNHRTTYLNKLRDFIGLGKAGTAAAEQYRQELINESQGTVIVDNEGAYFPE